MTQFSYIHIFSMHRTKRVWYSMSGGNAADKISSHAEKVCTADLKWLTWMQKNSGRRGGSFLESVQLLLGFHLVFQPGKRQQPRRQQPSQSCFCGIHIHIAPRTAAATATYQQPSIAAAYCAASWRRRARRSCSGGGAASHIPVDQRLYRASSSQPPQKRGT